MSNNNTPNKETNSQIQQASNANPDGIKIGQSATDLVALHGKVPVAMRGNASQAAVTTTVATTSSPFGFSTSTQANAVVTLLNEIRDTLVEKGVMKGSA